MSVVDQKEYLKKYLGFGKGSKEKKKKKKTKKAITGNRLKIVDDDIDAQFNQQVQEDLDGDNEDAPQIVSVIDDRPPSLRIDEKSKDLLWTPIGAPPNQTSFSETNKDISPERRRSKKRSESDSSPPRKLSKHVVRSPGRNQSDKDLSPIRVKKEKDDDCSPPRRKEMDRDLSPISIKREKSEDNSPPRRKRHNSDRDSSPPRRNVHRNENHLSFKFRSEKSSSKGSQRNSLSSSDKKSSRWSKGDDKLQKTLDGKTAGLQNAADLATETIELKKKEEELFKNLSSDVSGANAATIVRGKKKNIDWEEEEQKRKKELENKEKYEKWGKGLKQIDDANEKLQSELHEMSKPLARYADDEDLEKYLKEQERDGDPMLAYIRKKKKRKAIDEGKPFTQQYEGDAAPNRFGIRPGYRWDGVDRSNGYEKKWFEVQNSRTATVEESYKWSTEDM
ncbi:hypothetical protein ABEB36_001029 [Hypothenemus hampei]|uniref:BUD13 homolog n=1 Tax=Hypothenemus hampei TaxID=57062 RepID=A0ABD1FDB3_HYPHA